MFKIFVVPLLLLASNVALACACCGIDNEWHQSEGPANGYFGEIIQAVEITSGSFDDAPAYVGSVDVQQAINDKSRITFVTTKGDVVLNYSGAVQHNASDITFITNQDYRYTDDAEIYHEIILTGILLLPPALVSEFPDSNLEDAIAVKMILQGLGNGCMVDGTFTKWLIKPVDNDILFTGSGKLGVKNKNTVPEEAIGG